MPASLGVATLFALLIPLLIACGGTAPTPTSAPAAAATTAAGQATTAPTTAATAAPTRSATGSPAAAGSPAARPAAATPATQAGGFPSGGPNSTLEPVGRKGGHLTEGTFADAKTLNPMIANDGSSLTLISMMFNTLVALNPDTGLPYPDLAETVPSLENGGISKDGLTYTFQLRRDVKWSDGAAFTAKDVVYTYTTIAKKELAGSYAADASSRIESVTAPDDYTVVFKLKKIVAPFLIGFLSGSMYYIVPAHKLESVPVEQIKSHPFSTGDPAQTIGTGPFKFKEWVKDDHATLTKNPGYFRGEPALDEYILKVVRDANVVAAQLKTGEADFGTITAALWEELGREPNLTTIKYDTYSFTFYGYQLDPAKTTLFQDKRVRQALAYGLDRESMVKAILFGLGQVGHGTMPVLSWAYQPDEYTIKYTYDVGKAEQLLDDAGWLKGADGIRAKDGQRLSFTLWTNAGNKTREQYVTVMQQQWKAIGVEASPKTEEWNAYLTRITETHDFEMFLVGFGWQADPDQTSMWSCGGYTGGFNLNKYCNPRVDELLAQGLGELDQEKRKQYYLEMQNILLDELPSMILDFPQATVAVNKRVHNLKPNAINTRWNSHTWWVDDGR